MLADVNIGKLIREIISKKKISQAQFGRMLEKPATYVTRLLNKETVDTETLCDICSCLKYNFFADFSKPEILDEEYQCLIDLKDENDDIWSPGCVLYHPHIGNSIMEILKQKKKTQAELGNFLGVSHQEVSRLLKNKSIDTGKLVLISNFLNYNFFQDFYESNLEENKGNNKRYIGNNLFSASAADTPQTLDMDFERKLLASQLVSEVRRTPDHLSLTLTGDGVLAFVEALQTFAIENSSSTPENGHLFPKMNDDLIAKKDVMEGLGVTHTTLWKWEKMNI